MNGLYEKNKIGTCRHQLNFLRFERQSVITKTIAGNEKLTWPIISCLFFRFVQHGGEKFSFWSAIWNGLQMSYEQRLWVEVERLVLKTRFHVRRRKNSAKITPVFFFCLRNVNWHINWNFWTKNAHCLLFLLSFFIWRHVIVLLGLQTKTKKYFSLNLL